MNSQYLANLILKKMKDNNLRPICNDSLKEENLIKKYILDTGNNIQLKINGNSDFEIELPENEYSKSLSADFFFGKKRIDEQLKTISNLLECKCQPAWVIISTYYACYYLATELAKLYGIYIMNFTYSELNKLITFSDGQLKVGSNNSFKVTVSQSSEDQYVKLRFIRDSARPHANVWFNMSTISRDFIDSQAYSSLSADDLHHLTLFNDILKGENDWNKLNEIRNVWNYTSPFFFIEKGTSLAKKFMNCIVKSSEARSWGNDRQIKKNEENKAASVAYIYHLLNETIQNIYFRLESPEKIKNEKENVHKKSILQYIVNWLFNNS